MLGKGKFEESLMAPEDSDLFASAASSPSGYTARRCGYRHSMVEVTKDDEKVTQSPSETRGATKSPSKSRSLSESTPKLSIAPKASELPRQSKDDSFTTLDPRTPTRSALLSRGLSLQMPAREFNVSSPASRVPPSPQADKRSNYGSPVTVLPRHSRGLDFSRACTNLHHSTLAERSSPDASPTITQKGMVIPSRRGTISSMVLDPPNFAAQPVWPTAGSGGKTGPSSSVGSINMLDSDSSSSGVDDDELMEPDDGDDPIMPTPQGLKLGNVNAPNLFGGPLPSPGGAWPGTFSPSAASFMNYQRAKLKRKGKSRNSSSSASRHSSLASPVPASPPVRSVESGNGSYFAREVVMRNSSSRRESLTLGTNELHISSGNDSGDDSALPGPATPAVIRRPVTRRGNLLPKTKCFSRIRTELLEESTPVDSEARREAEIIRQVRVSDLDVDRFQASTAHSSPTLTPTLSSDLLTGIPEDGTMTLDGPDDDVKGKASSGSFSQHVSRHSGGREFWQNFDHHFRIPPPHVIARCSFSAISDDVSLESPSLSASSTSIASHPFPGVPEQGKDCQASRASTPQPSCLPSVAEVAKRVRKRRRDDEFDIASLKRRAVSPGMSVQNSPVLSQSPAQRDGNLWGQPKMGRESSSGVGTTEERTNSGSSFPGLISLHAPKRFGVQGFSDTHDGLMKMSIE